MSSHKICLINPPTTDPSQGNIYFPMALITLGGVLKREGWGAELWDFDLYFKRVGNATERQFLKLLRAGVKSLKRPIFGISSICSNFPMALYIAKQIKEFRPESLVIFGGPQPSSVPEQTLERFSFVDLVVAGEGERTLERLIQIDFDPSQFEGIPGVLFRKNEKIVTNPKRELVENMDDLPLPDYSLVNLADYICAQHGVFAPGIEVGRGCPFHCTFCSTALMWEKEFRVKSPRRILDEMDALNREFGFTQFEFIHDNFTTSRKFVLDFCDYFQKHRHPDYLWTASSRTDCIDVARLEKLHQAGCRGLFFGIETGSERMQKIIKKDLDFAKFEDILLAIHRLGMKSTTAFIIGFPEESETDMNDTVLRALHYKCYGMNRVFVSKLAALTGTGIYRQTAGKLTEISYTTTINPLNYGLPYVDELIAQHPDLFSSFYYVPHPIFCPEYIVKFEEFTNLAVNGHPHLVLKIMHNLNWTPSRLFREWDDWAQQSGIVYWDYRHYCDARFRLNFESFLEEKLFSQITADERLRPYESILPVQALARVKQAVLV